MKKSKLVYIVPVLCVISMLIYHTAIFMYLPIVFVLLFYIAIKEKSKSYMWVFVVSLLLSSGLFIYLQLFGKIAMHTYWETFTSIGEITSFKPRGEYLKAEYFMEFAGHRVMVQNKMPTILNRLILSLVIFAPVLYCIYYIFIKALKDAKSCKLVYLAMLVNVLTFVPVFIFAVDYGRWISGIFITQLVLVLSLIYLKDDVIIGAIQRLQEKFVKRKYLVVAAICLYGMMCRFSHYEVIPLADCLNNLADIIARFHELIIT